MKHDDLDRQEAQSQALIRTLAALSRDVKASSAFHMRVMARAEERMAGYGWPLWAQRWPSPVAARLVMAAALIVALIGAVPQYVTWIKAYRMGVPSESMHEARLQEALWEKNFMCATQLDRRSANYAAITGEDIVVVTWACPSGDVLVTVESAHDGVARRSVWIPLSVPQHTASALDVLVRQASAAVAARQTVKQPQPMITVLCQKWLPNRLILRRIELANERCIDEILDPRTGRVLKRSGAPCERRC